MTRFKLPRCKFVHGLHPLPGGWWLVAIGCEAHGFEQLAWVDPAGETVQRSIGVAESLAVSVDGRRLAVGRRVFDTFAGLLQVGPTDPGAGWRDLPAPFASEEGTSIVSAVGFGPGGEVYAAATQYQGQSPEFNNRLVRYPAGGRPPTTVTRLPSPIGVLAVSADGRRVAASGGRHGLADVSVYDAKSGQEAGEFRLKSTRTAAVAFAPDGSRLAAACGRRGFLLDPDTGAEVAGIGDHRKQLNAVAFTPDGRQVLTACHDGVVRAWDVATGSPGVEWDFQVGPVTAVAVAHDGLTAIAGGSQGRVVVWDLDG